MKIKYIKNVFITLCFLIMIFGQLKIVFAADADSIMSGGDSFITEASESKIDTTKMQETSSTIYSVLLSLRNCNSSYNCNSHRC